MKIKLILLSILVLTGFEACTEETQGDTIQIGTTYKIVYDSDILMIGDIEYQWSFGKKPSNSYSVLLCSRDKALFTPDVPGEYEIHVYVNNEGVVSDAKDYFFLAVGTVDTTKREKRPAMAGSRSLIADITAPGSVETAAGPAPSSLKDSPKPVVESTADEPTDPGSADSLSVFYTIQVYSQSNQKTAEENRDMLVSKGYPAYIQPFRIPGKDHPWYRVRVGRYPDLGTALTHKKTLSRLLKSEDLWIDTLRTDG
ncbi:MAG: SPOR domain-containing protein [FCB group bacterium]|nr:SPOR domain-containing protein [FCB group bacterium]